MASNNSVNMAIILGNLGDEPDVHSTPSGKCVVNLAIATNETWIDGQGEKRKNTEWHKVVVWGRAAEACADYLHKGSQVHVVGRLHTRSWEDRDGNKRYEKEIICDEIKFLNTRTVNGNVKEE
jgi:single-strand DNA-binding protein